MSENKVKLPRLVVNVLDDFRDSYAGYEWMVMATITRDPGEKEKQAHSTVREFAKRSEPNFVKIMQALVNGYEAEETPEDKVREYYQQLHDADALTEGERKRHKKILTHTLDLLGKKITGINE